MDCICHWKLAKKTGRVKHAYNNNKTRSVALKRLPEGDAYERKYILKIACYWLDIGGIMTSFLF